MTPPVGLAGSRNLFAGNGLITAVMRPRRAGNTEAGPLLLRLGAGTNGEREGLRHDRDPLRDRNSRHTPADRLLRARALKVERGREPPRVARAEVSVDRSSLASRPVGCCRASGCAAEPRIGGDTPSGPTYAPIAVVEPCGRPCWATGARLNRAKLMRTCKRSRRGRTIGRWRYGSVRLMGVSSLYGQTTDSHRRLDCGPPVRCCRMAGACRGP